MVAPLAGPWDAWPSSQSNPNWVNLAPAAPRPPTVVNTNFLPPLLAKQLADTMPSEAEGLRIKLAKYADRAEKESLCTCATPCGGAIGSGNWGFLRTDNIRHLQSKNVDNMCPVMVPDAKGSYSTEEFPLFMTSNGLEAMRRCSVHNEKSQSRLRQQADDAVRAANANELAVGRDMSLVTVLMVQYNLSRQDAQMYASTPHLTPREILLTAGLANAYMQFLREMQAPDPGQALHTPALVQMWKKRLARFDSLAVGGMEPRSRPQAPPLSPTLLPSYAMEGQDKVANTATLPTNPTNFTSPREVQRALDELKLAQARAQKERKINTVLQNIMRS